MVPSYSIFSPRVRYPPKVGGVPRHLCCADGSQGAQPRLSRCVGGMSGGCVVCCCESVCVCCEVGECLLLILRC